MAKRVKTSSVTYKMTLEQMKLFIETIKDLTKLDATTIINISNTEMLLFSVVGKNLDNVHAFKSHTLPLSDIFSVNKNTLTNDIRYILSDSKRFVTSMMAFYKYMTNQKIDDDVEFKLFYNDDFCERLLIKNSKSKEETPGGKPNPHVHRLDVEDIEDVMDTSFADYSFDLSKEDFTYIKAKTAIDKDNDILYLNINNNKLSIGENRWDHSICDLEHDDVTISFPKKYFKCINYDNEDVMKIFVTDTLLLVVGDSTNLLISIELTI